MFIRDSAVILRASLKASEKMNTAESVAERRKNIEKEIFPSIGAFLKDRSASIRKNLDFDVNLEFEKNLDTRKKNPQENLSSNMSDASA